MSAEQASRTLPPGRFAERAAALPFLGVGVSTEYGASRSPTALDALELSSTHPELARFLEVGVEVAKGLDESALAWVDRGGRTTYHFLDLNLDDPADFDAHWIRGARAIARRLRPAWVCGDAGLWHHGPRERGHMLLLPPILSREAARAQAEGIVRLREALSLEVLPENPPGEVFIGDLHLLDYFALVCEQADTGMLLDCAHLAIYQHAMGHAPTCGLDAFPLDRIVELHVAGARWREVDGYRFPADDHTTAVLDQTWEIFEAVLERAPQLRAVVFECERNRLEDVLPGFARISAALRRHPRWRGEPPSPEPPPPPPAPPRSVEAPPEVSARAHGPAAPEGPAEPPCPVRLQRAVVRMHFDPKLAAAVYAASAPSTARQGGERAPAEGHRPPSQSVADPLGLGPAALRWLTRPDPRAWRADPERPARALTGLLEEYLVSATAAAALGTPPGELARFFSSPSFHDCIDRGGSLAWSFGGWLASHDDFGGVVAPLAILEQGVARCRRTGLEAPPAPQPPPPRQRGFRLEPSPSARLQPLPPDAVTRWRHVRATLPDDNPSALTRLLSAGAPREVATLLEGWPRGGASEPWLMEYRAEVGRVDLSPAAEGVAAVLALAEQRVHVDDALAAMQRFDLSPDEAEEVLRDLASEGLIGWARV